MFHINICCYMFATLIKKTIWQKLKVDRLGTRVAGRVITFLSKLCKSLEFQIDQMTITNSRNISCLCFCQLLCTFWVDISFTPLFICLVNAGS